MGHSPSRKGEKTPPAFPEGSQAATQAPCSKLCEVPRPAKCPGRDPRAQGSWVPLWALAGSLQVSQKASVVTRRLGGPEQQHEGQVPAIVGTLCPGQGWGPLRLAGLGEGWVARSVLPGLMPLPSLRWPAGSCGACPCPECLLAGCGVGTAPLPWAAQRSRTSCLIPPQSCSCSGTRRPTVSLARCLRPSQVSPTGTREGAVGLSRETWARAWGLEQTRSPLSPGQQTLSQGLPGEDFRTCGHGHVVCVSAVLLCLRLTVDKTTDHGHRAHRGKGARPHALCADS